MTMALAPSVNDPNRKSELKRKERDPDGYQGINREMIKPVPPDHKRPEHHGLSESKSPGADFNRRVLALMDELGWSVDTKQHAKKIVGLMDQGMKRDDAIKLLRDTGQI
jgi:hypothetical protein